jgi:hypothetical protein
MLIDGCMDIEVRPDSATGKPMLRVANSGAAIVTPESLEALAAFLQAEAAKLRGGARPLGSDPEESREQRGVR